MKGKSRKPRKGSEAKPAKVYIGFWTWPDTKDAIRKLATRNRQSASAYIDGVIDEHLARMRWGHR